MHTVRSEGAQLGGTGLGSLGPVAAATDRIKDQPLLAALHEGLPVQAVVEFALVVRICINPVGFSSTEPGAAGAAGAARATAGGGGSLGDGRQGLTGGNTLCNSTIPAGKRVGLMLPAVPSLHRRFGSLHQGGAGGGGRVSEEQGLEFRWERTGSV